MVSETNALEPRLEANEEVLWSGTGSGVNPSRSVLAPPLLLLAAFIFASLLAYLNEFDVQNLVFLFAIGLVLLATAWFATIRYKSPSTERYWITNKRIMIASPSLGGEARSFVPPMSDIPERHYRQFQAIKVLPRRKSIYFEPHLVIRGRRDIIPVFVGVDDLEVVAQIAAEAFQMTPKRT